MSDKTKRFIARLLLVSALAIAPAVGIIAETMRSPPPPATLAMRRGTLVYVQRLGWGSRRKPRLAVLVTDDNQDFSASVNFPELFARVSELAPKTRVTLYTADSYWFDRTTPAPDVWQIDTNAGTVLSYTQTLAAWQASRKRTLHLFSLLAVIPLVVCCCLDWFELRSGEKDH